MTSTQRLRFACALATADVDRFTSKDTHYWEGQLRSFFQAGKKTPVAGKPSEWERGGQGVEYPNDWRNLQRAAQVVMNPAVGKAGTYATALSYIQEIIPSLRGGQGSIVVRGTIMSVFPRVLTDTLISEGTAHLRACGQCGQPFVRGRSDNQYCKRPSCRGARQAAYWRKYIQTPKGRKARARQLRKMRGSKRV